jgi:hypothetical protein
MTTPAVLAPNTYAPTYLHRASPNRTSFNNHLGVRSGRRIVFRVRNGMPAFARVLVLPEATNLGALSALSSL